MCVLRKVKGESSDVNIQFLCVTKESIIGTRGKGEGRSKVDQGRPVNEALTLHETKTPRCLEIPGEEGQTDALDP